MNEIFQIGFALCLIGYIIHTIVHTKEYKYGKYKNSRIDMLLSLVIFLGYFGWGLMLFNDKSILLPNQYTTGFVIGLALSLVGSLLFILAANTLKGFTATNDLVTSGVYARMRNPMYTGIILMHLGVPLLLNRLLTFASNVIWIPLILFWIYLEEKDLEKIFGHKYLEYKKRTIL
jgi:protein-S-isoprenylcysteine O-methyltransferase Ste14